jgi:hypothetical protein
MRDSWFVLWGPQTVNRLISVSARIVEALLIMDGCAVTGPERRRPTTDTASAMRTDPSLRIVAAEAATGPN